MNYPFKYRQSMPAPVSPEAQITVPRDKRAWVIEELTSAGLTVLDTGERVTTDEGVDHEAILHIATYQKAEQEASNHGRLLRP